MQVRHLPLLPALWVQARPFIRDAVQMLASTADDDATYSQQGFGRSMPPAQSKQILSSGHGTCHGCRRCHGLLGPRHSCPSPRGGKGFVSCSSSGHIIMQAGHTWSLRHVFGLHTPMPSRLTITRRLLQPNMRLTGEHFSPDHDLPALPRACLERSQTRAQSSLINK